MPTDDEKEIILEFVAESLETLETVEPVLIRMETMLDPDELQSTIDLIFRPFHSLKGGAGFLNFETIQKVTHTAESLLQKFRSNAMLWQPHYAGALVQSCDLLQSMLAHTEEKFHDNGFEEEANEVIRELNKHLRELNEGDDNLPPSTDPAQDEETDAAIPSLPETLRMGAELLQSLLNNYWSMFEEQKSYSGVKDLIKAMEFHFAQENQALSPFPDIVFPDDEAPAISPIKEPDDESVVVSKEQKKLFYQEALELLENAEGAFLVVEKLAGEVEVNEYLQSAIRSIHTFKGNAGFLFLTPLEELSHEIETVLQLMLDETFPAESASMQVLLESLDVLKTGVSSFHNGEKIDSIPCNEAVLDLKTKVEKSSNSPKLGNILIEMGAVTTLDVEEAVQEQERPLGDILVQMGKVSPKLVEDGLERQEKVRLGKLPETPSAPKPLKKQEPILTAKTQDIRVNLNKLDQLIDLVGELVISEAMISQHPSLENIELENLKQASAQLHRNMRDLQEIVMSMRMVPVMGLFRKMVRVVHDASKKLEKKTELELEGEKTEMDKTVVEKITDPLLHIIRNAVDHGMETPQERSEAGKEGTGTIKLTASHVGNEVWISIEDNGRGMNRERILQKAIERGLLKKGAVLPDSEIWKLILEPGFSTAETVTDFSGRGVGMDVVKKNIEKLNGEIEIESSPGLGSKVVLKIPLTLSIIDGLLVQVGDVTCALPTIAIRETLQPLSANIQRLMDGSEMLRLRKRLLPVVRLHRLYELEPRVDQLSEGMLLVIEQGGRSFCLFVDMVLGQQQVVVKGLPETMTNVPHLAGCTILGTGQVGLILDAASLARTAQSTTIDNIN